MAAPRSRAGLLSAATLSLVAAATTWTSLLSWRGFVELSGRFLGPLLVLAAVVVLSGALARWWRAPSPVVVATQMVASGIVACLLITGSPLPVGAGWAELVAELETAAESANTYAPPVPAEAAGVEPLLILGGLALLLLVDVLACTLRRIPLAGLPLLTIFSVPLSMLGEGPSWWVFALTAAGFLTMLFVHEDEQVSRWGRSLERDPGGGDADAFGVRTGAVRANAGAIGGVVTALAIVVPLLIPTLDLQVFDFGPGAGGGDDITIENPMVDLRRDLIRGEDVDLLTVTTEDPDPSYLRIAVLNRFTDEEWSSGDRDIPASNDSRTVMPALEGVDAAVTRREFDYQVAATDDFTSRWLPTTQHINRIDAPGDWRYDAATRDFIASGDTDTAGLDWTFRAVELNLDADRMATAASSAGLVDSEFTDLPDDLDDTVRQLALQVTENAPSRFEKAVALQQWFRVDGGFTYDDSEVLDNGADDLVAFLRDIPGGRRGYCEQFAASMAVMARILGIPARVAVGFLRPDRVDGDTYVYSAHDLHAWPELYISGAGWVRFEPTPGGRAETVPAYTEQEVDLAPEPTATADEEDIANPPVRDEASDQALPEQDQDAGSSGSSVPWIPVLTALALVALVLLVVLAPRTLRRRRREVRLRGSAEDVWRELRDTARDLGLAWPGQRSPRETADVLVRWFGAPLDDHTPERPRRGPDTNPDAVTSLDRVVLALELTRYAERASGPDGSWSADGETCVQALLGGAPRRARRRAAWWPRSLWVREQPTERRPGDPGDDDGSGQRPAYAGAVERVS